MATRRCPTLSSTDLIIASAGVRLDLIGDGAPTSSIGLGWASGDGDAPSAWLLGAELIGPGIISTMATSVAFG
jgi:hypothetical protein